MYHSVIVGSPVAMRRWHSRKYAALCAASDCSAPSGCKGAKHHQVFRLRESFQENPLSVVKSGDNPKFAGCGSRPKRTRRGRSGETTVVFGTCRGDAAFSQEIFMLNLVGQRFEDWEEFGS